MSDESITLDTIDRGRADWLSGLYRNGCDLASSCFDCPLPACRYEMPPGRARREIRQGEVIALLRQGKHPDAVANELNISRRTVNRLRKGQDMNQTTDRLQDALNGRRGAGSIPVEQVPRLTHDATPDWIAAAKHSLKAHLEAIVGVEHHKTEAEKIHAALSAYGAVGLPVLPWVTDKVKRTRTVTMPERACDACGRQAVATAFHMVDGRRVCRKAAECAARQRGAA